MPARRQLPQGRNMREQPASAGWVDREAREGQQAAQQAAQRAAQRAAQQAAHLRRAAPSSPRARAAAAPTKMAPVRHGRSWRRSCCPVQPWRPRAPRCPPPPIPQTGPGIQHIRRPLRARSYIIKSARPNRVRCALCCGCVWRLARVLIRSCVHACPSTPSRQLAPRPPATPLRESWLAPIVCARRSSGLARARARTVLRVDQQIFRQEASLRAIGTPFLSFSGVRLEDPQRRRIH